MSDEGVFKQSRRKIMPDEVAGEEQNVPFVNPLDRIREVQEAMGEEVEARPSRPMPSAGPSESPFQIAGNMPEEFREVLMQRGQPKQEQAFQAPRTSSMARPARPETRLMSSNEGSDELAELLNRIAPHTNWEEVELPSKGKFYDNIPTILHIRPMCGEEEQILATPRFVRKGQAIDKIFKNCIRETIDTTELLSIDRTYLLIYLRGISYTPEYDVEVKCQECATKFNTVINLDLLEVESCPDNFSRSNLTGTLPKTGFKFGYRIAKGDDEAIIAKHREVRIKEYGDQNEDDTLTFRTALLLENIEGVTQRQELELLLKKLPIADVAHLRNVINNPPFGVDTEVGLVCPSCMAEFEIELPLEANFFFPRKKETRTPQ